MTNLFSVLVYRYSEKSKMKTIKFKCITLALMLILFSVAAFAQTQSELNSKAYSEYEKADKSLNDIYKKIKAAYFSDTVFIKNLKASQRLWVKFRDAEMQMKYPENKSYGSAQPMCYSLYLQELTEDRIKTLKVWLDGIAEGDVCAGSVKKK